MNNYPVIVFMNGMGLGSMGPTLWTCATAGGTVSPPWCTHGARMRSEPPLTLDAKRKNKKVCFGA